MLLTFRMLGFGWNGDGILLDPTIQSAKLIAVWTQLDPLPLIVTQPALMAAAIRARLVGYGPAASRPRMFRDG